MNNEKERPSNVHQTSSFIDTSDQNPAEDTTSSHRSSNPDDNFTNNENRNNRVHNKNKMLNMIVTNTRSLQPKIESLVTTFEELEIHVAVVTRPETVK